MVDTAADAARRNFLEQGMRIGLLMRHGGALVIYAVVLIVTPTAGTAGAVFAAAAGAWALYRLVSRSVSSRALAVDYAVTVAACLAIPVLVSDEVCQPTGVAVSIAGTAILSFTVLAPLLDVAMTVGVVAALVTGSALADRSIASGALVSVYYFALLWAAATVVQMLTVRVTDSVDNARAERLAVELRQQVSAAVREYDREQMRLLHDTVASTLLMVGTGTALSSDRVAVQARRDLEVFTNTSRMSASSADLVAALRDYAAHISTPVHYAGAAAMWLDGATTATIAAAAREALTNVDQHSGATAVTVTVTKGLIQIADDGSGFDVSQPVRGHGIARSIIARMEQLVGAATITSTPGHGTTVELRWPTDRSEATTPPPDPERLIERGHAGYALVLISYGLVNLFVTVPSSLRVAADPYLQWTLIVVSAAATLSAVPGILGRPSIPARIGITALMTVALVQSATLPIHQLAPRLQWAEGAIGWCVLPLLMGQRPRVGVGVLIWCWTVPGIAEIIRNPTAANVVDFGYDTASVLIPQLCALLMTHVIRRTAVVAAAETDSQMRLAATTRIADAVQAEYQRRYANLAGTIRPLLSVLAEGGPVGAVTRRRAQVEYQRLRTLFDQSASFEHVLLRELRPHVDAAQNRGIAVSIHVEGTLPAMDDAVARQLARMLDRVLTAATNSARITVTADMTAVELSVIGLGFRHSELPTKSGVGDEDEFDLTILDDTVWITVRHTLPEGPSHNARAGRPT
ncbi:ATP-binding protein [Mycobacterium sp. CBMA293]|uniref:sensor histidine kinase n=1 Tax=unclassified Mycolicibacterium TaxID=2636767 RepID=UPI0012DFC723|nr:MULTISPECIES: ATP-binding protein [unclassified Mycolicibacterium]MUL48677.1 ATP-binding protein [Mycolicibacterium sp. CBMA 360]MUL60825.1 ATP-binding protein [Mycolicibacterium sp. CBMA 335]MUL71838.1 ATP-binding protein [Mycolicibacterium sp. CBMA 311]MUL95766.1 ATP-binding protein [Mycolicibacterium sp. CBMA 230]MUM06364.1 hypothetical protein [Mycolicibacterium sp. CBMA 213]